MNQSTCCPKCDQPLTQVGEFWVCPKHGQVAAEAPFAPLRIFLSYGHDANEELVRRIKADLEKRGHDVWFDKSEIKFGDDWRRSITEGITGSHKFVSFLSKHSTRDPGVCRDEIAIAIGVKGGNIQTILVESEAEVQPPVNIGHIQWLDMHDWKNGHGIVRLAKDEPAVGDAAWENWYQAQFVEVVRVVESAETLRFAGEIKTLCDQLDPIKSDARVYQLLSKGFYGRQWMFEAVEKWREGPKQDSRLFWIMGPPGIGKSAFAAQLTHTRSDTVIAAQFCDWNMPDHRDARRVVCSIAFQLATRLPDYRKLLVLLPEIAKLDQKNADELFNYLLANPLRLVIRGERERYLIVIDALDEAGEAGRNPLVEMLARHAPRLPDWIGLVVTSRPESNVIAPLQSLNPFPFETSSEKNLADIRGYLRHELASQLQGRTDTDRLVGQILEKSEGVFLYVERVCDDIRRGHLSLERPEQFPQGLGESFLQDFLRQFPDDEKYEKSIEPALGAILAAREPLPVEILQKVFGWRETELKKWLRTFGSLFPVTTEAGNEVIKPHHKALADWLTNAAKAGPYFVSVLEGHRILGEFCSHQWREGSIFAISEAVYHLHYEDASVNLPKLLSNPAYYEQKVAVCGLKRLYEDLHYFVSLPYDPTANAFLDGCCPKVKAVFGIAALISFDLDYTGCATTSVLRKFVESDCNGDLLAIGREELKPMISSAESKPRVPQGMSHYVQYTAHNYDDYLEWWLKAKDAALALVPTHLIDCIKRALRFHAMYQSDTDTIEDLKWNIKHWDEEFNTKLPVLQGLALQLNTTVTGLEKAGA